MGPIPLTSPLGGCFGDSLHQDVGLPIEVLECRGQGSFSAIPLDTPTIDYPSSAKELLGTGLGPRQSLGRIANFPDPQVVSGTRGYDVGKFTK